MGCAGHLRPSSRKEGTTLSDYDLLIFDWDGTVADSTAGIVEALRHAARGAGLDELPATRLRAVIGLGLAEAVHSLHPQASPMQAQAMVAGYRDYYRGVAARGTRLFPGARELLAEFGACGLSLAVATGKSRNGLLGALRDTGLEGRFAALRTADDCPSKPHPAMVLELLDELGCSPDRALMIGDSEYDLAMALAAGVRSVAVGADVELVDGCIGRVDTVAGLSALL